MNPREFRLIDPSEPLHHEAVQAIARQMAKRIPPGPLRITMGRMWVFENGQRKMYDLEGNLLSVKPEPFKLQ